jgi:hypothetical protein
MFTDNWFLFLLIVMLVFASDGAISQTETAVLLAILFALCLCCNVCNEDAPDDCFCNRSTTAT